jgi:lipid-binding SYLF domain-containing protein
MLTTSNRPSGLLLSYAFVLLAGCASPKTLDDARSTADASEATLNAFLGDAQMTWLRENFPRAKAVLISPQILAAGFIVGASGGNAVVMARNASGRGWTGPAFYKMGTGSIGLQAGAEASQLVGLVMTEKALDSLLSSSFKLGGDVSIAAGPVGGGAGGQINADIVVYTRAKGLYGGVNLTGTVVSTDDKGNQSFYGRPATPVDILVRHSVSNSLSQSLGQSVARAEASSRAR